MGFAGECTGKGWSRPFAIASLGFAMLACGPLRTIDGSGNNLHDLEMGAAETPLMRLMDADYAWSEDLPSAREISNLLCDQPDHTPRAGAHALSDMVWQWGQFIDHDIDLTPEGQLAESKPIAVPEGDPWFDPHGTGEEVIEFGRSTYQMVDGSREQMNMITAWLDGSNVYGSDPERAAALRMKDGTGRLAMSADRLLPFNDAGLPNAGGSSASLFLAGDQRANEQVGLTAMHTLWVREHNFWANQIRSRLPQLSGDEIYEAVRVIIAAEIQIITYEEFLPAVLGVRAIPPYKGYDPTVNARIANEFSTAAYRFGHSMLSPTLMRVDRMGRSIEQGPLALRDAFFAPHRILEEGGIEPLLRGLATQRAQHVDPYMIDDVRNFLFGPPGSGGFDLAALNIQRGRDHGLPSYNDVRVAMGFDRARNFDDITSDPKIASRLREAYEQVDRVELWIGGLAEDHAPGAIVGPLVHAVLVDQFTALRDGDRFWYANVLPPAVSGYLERTTRLSTVIRRNSTIGRELPQDVFRVDKPDRRRSRRSR